MKEFKKVLSLWLLAGFNFILVAMSWIMMIYAYPRLPSEIPYWLNLAGEQVIKSAKSVFFFIYPLVQTFFITAFWLVSRIWIKKSEEESSLGKISEELFSAIKQVKIETILLALIFFNMIFIHVERSLIWLAHGLSRGVNKFYFFSLLIILLLLIPYYRLRLSLLLKIKNQDAKHIS